MDKKRNLGSEMLSVFRRYAFLASLIGLGNDAMKSCKKKIGATF